MSIEIYGGSGPKVSVQMVANLHAERDRVQPLVQARLDAGYYREDGVNPWDKLAKLLPKTARFYMLVPERDEASLKMARRILKGLATKRFGLRESSHLRRDVNYNGFAPPGKIVLLYT